MIHVCFCFQDRTGHYAKFAGTAMLSLFENHSNPSPTHLPSITVHILHDDTLTVDNRDKFIYLAGQYNQLVKFYNIEDLCADKISKMIEMVPSIEKSRVSIGAFFKFLIPNLLPAEVEKAIYLDTDTITNLDINELWSIDIENYPLGTVLEKLNGVTGFPVCHDGILKIDDYFNSGVLLMNLKVLRGEEDTILKGLEFKRDNPKYKQFDQLIFNYCFSTRALKLPLKFNRFAPSAHKAKELPAKKIYHYVDHQIRLNMENPFSRLWMNYFMRTPWFDADVIGRMYEELLRIRSYWQDRVVSLSAIVSGKSRAFFVEPTKIDSTKKFFSIRADETIIAAENEESLRKLIDAMKTSQGQVIFFIMTPKFLKKPFPFDLLKKEGFVDGKNFFRGWTFLSPERGGDAFNSYSIVKLM